MKPANKYYQLIPEKVLKELPAIVGLLSTEIKGFCPDYLKEIISIVACHIRKDSEEAPFKMTYIKKIVPQGDKYLKGLIELEIIKRSGTAIIGQTSYKYSFAPDYKSKFLPVPLNNQKLIRRIELASEDMRKEAAKSIRTHGDQVKYLKQLTIDEIIRKC